MSRFQHKRLRVYEEAMKLVVAVDPLAAKLERRRYYLADQIRRAALSIVLNIAEGASAIPRFRDPRSAIPRSADTQLTSDSGH